MSDKYVPPHRRNHSGESYNRNFKPRRDLSQLSKFNVKVPQEDSLSLKRTNPIEMIEEITAPIIIAPPLSPNKESPYKNAILAGLNCDIDNL